MRIVFLLMMSIVIASVAGIHPVCASPGTVTVSGSWNFYEQDSETLRSLRNAKVELWDHSPFPSHLKTASTNEDGRYEFDPVENYGLDITVKVFTENSIVKVTDMSNNVYSYETDVHSGFPDGNYDMGAEIVAADDRGSCCIFDTIEIGHDFVDSLGYDQPSVVVIWPHDTGSKTDYPLTIHIGGGNWQDEWDEDVILHEYGHIVQYSVYEEQIPHAGGYWEWDYLVHPNHAFSEGWATFFAVAANFEFGYGDALYPQDSWDIDVEQPPLESDQHDLEAWPADKRAPNPYEYPGAVACTLWDIYDSNVDDLEHRSDTLSAGMSPIWDVFRNYEVEDPPEDDHHVYNIREDFWDGWFDREHNEYQYIWDIYYHHLLGIFDEFPPAEPDTPVGETTGYTNYAYEYYTVTTDPRGDDLRYFFDWDDGSADSVTDWRDSGAPGSAIHSWSSPGEYHVTAYAQDIHGPLGFSFNSSVSDPLTVTIQSPPPGCPYVSAWNGTQYVLDNNLLGNSEVSNGSDVEDFYKLEQTLIPTYQGTWFSHYSLLISEFEHEHSYLDKIRLYAIDHDPNVRIALTPDGEILTYAHPNPPTSAIDNYGHDWRLSLLEPDDICYRGFPDDYLLLDFGSLDISQGAKLVLRANEEWKKDMCIHVQVLDEIGVWTDAVALRTRHNWSTSIMDLADYLPNPDGTLKIRLYFTGIHKIDYVGLDTTPQADTTSMQTCAVSALHSTQGKVTLKLLLNDQVYAELFPDEQIELKFILPNNTAEARTFIIYVDGHYETIS